MSSRVPQYCQLGCFVGKSSQCCRGEERACHMVQGVFVSASYPFTTWFTLDFMRLWR